MIVRQSLLRDQLHIFSLVGIAIAYPVFSFLLANPAYLIANGMTAKNVYIMIALLSFMLPTILILTGLVLSSLHKRSYRGFHLALVWLLIALAFMPVLSRFDALSVWLVFGIAAALSVLATREYHTNLITYTGLLVLAPIGLALPIHFALDHSINQILNPKPPEDFEWQGSGSRAIPPVVLIVFDELPLVHILDEHGDIDRKRFPNFAALGDEGTWYSNASTVHDQTIKAVPAILSGLYPGPSRILPVPENYPHSLFAILRSQYRVHATESLTALADAGHEDPHPGTVDTRTVTTDIGIFYLRSLLPATAADAWLPLQNGIWGGFLSKDDLREWLSNNADWRTGDRALTRRFQVAKRFVTELDSFPRNTFHYFHIALPHRPYGYLPSGRQYEYAMREDKFNVHDMTVGEISQGRAAHILQVGLADSILGKFKEKLLELGYWDDALVIVVADHGQAYQPEKNNRIVTPENFGNVAFVPLLIKYPGQKVAEVDNSNVQTIDIAPTVIDVLGIGNAPQMDGRSLLDDSAEVPKEKMIMSESGENYEFSAETYDLARTNAHAEAATFFALYDKRSNLFNYGAGLDYIGEKLATLDEYRIQAQLNVHNPEKYQSVDMQAEFFPAFIQGQVVKHPKLNSNDVVVAISINGIVRAVTTPHFSPEGQLLFNKILPEDALESTNDLEAVLLVADKMHVGAVQRSFTDTAL